MDTVLSKNAIDFERQRLLTRLKNDHLIKLELVVDMTENTSADVDDGLTIPDFRKTLHK